MVLGFRGFRVYGVHGVQGVEDSGFTGLGFRASGLGRVSVLLNSFILLLEN